MTVAIEHSSEQFQGGGTASFAFTYVGAFAEDNDVYLTTATTNQLSSGLFNLTLNATASGYIWGIGGTVTYPLSGPNISAGAKLTVVRNLPLLQTYPVPNQSSYPPRVVEAALDYEMMCLQDLKDALDRALRGPIIGPPISDLPGDRNGKCLAFDDADMPIAVTCSSGTIGPPGPSGTNGLVKRTVFTSGSGTFTAQSTTTAVYVKLVGAGGGGSWAGPTALNNVSIGGGGLGGAYAEKWMTASFNHVAYSVGVAGTGGTSTTPSTSGTSTTFATITAGGGQTGISLDNATGISPFLYNQSVGTAATATGGDINLPGEKPSCVGWAIGVTDVLSRRGGRSLMGFGGKSAVIQGAIAAHQAGTAGGGYGSGGSGGTSADNGAGANGGAGKSGCLVIEEYG